MATRRSCRARAARPPTFTRWPWPEASPRLKVGPRGLVGDVLPGLRGTGWAAGPEGLAGNAQGREGPPLPHSGAGQTGSSFQEPRSQHGGGGQTGGGLEPPDPAAAPPARPTPHRGETPGLGRLFPSGEARGPALTPQPAAPPRPWGQLPQGSSGGHATGEHVFPRCSHKAAGHHGGPHGPQQGAGKGFGRSARR